MGLSQGPAKHAVGANTAVEGTLGCGVPSLGPAKDGASALIQHGVLLDGQTSGIRCRELMLSAVSCKGKDMQAEMTWLRDGWMQICRVKQMVHGKVCDQQSS